MTLIIGLFIVFIMLFSSASGAFYSSNSTSSTASSNHIYLVTTKIGGSNYSYYEDVNNGKILKTWAAPSAISTNEAAGSTQSNTTSSKDSLNTVSVKPYDQRSSEVLTGNYSDITSDNISSSYDKNNQGSGFNITETYSVSSITLSPTSSNINVGQNLNLVGTWTGGLPPYNIEWSIIHAQSGRPVSNYFTNFTSETSASFIFSPDHPGVFEVTLTVNGSSAGDGLTAYSVISVNNQPQGPPGPQGHNGPPGPQPTPNGNQLENLTLTPSASVMDSGQPIDFVGNWTGSSKFYNYEWFVSSEQLQWKSFYQGDENNLQGYSNTPQSSVSFTFNPVYGSYGIYYLYLFVNTAGGPGNQQGQGNQQESLAAFAEIVLLPGTPGVTSVTISPSSLNGAVNSGVPINFAGNWSGGTAPYSYVWYVTNDKNSFLPNTRSPYILQFASYNYTNGNSASFQYTPNSTGNFYVYLFVNSASSAAYVMAVSQIYSKQNFKPTVTQATITPTTVNANIGEVLNFNGNWTGGVSPYTYVWYVSQYFPHWQRGFRSFSSVNSTSQPEANFTYIPTNYGIYYLYLFVNNHVGNTPPNNDEDSDDGLAIVTTAEIIVLHPSQPLTSSAITISPTTTNLGSPINATVTPGYGVAPFTYSWSVTSQSGTTISSSSYSTLDNQITFSSPGSYSVTVTVTDSTGVSASQTASVKILSQLSVSISVSGLKSIDKGESSTLVANSLSGGLPPYTGQWMVEQPGFQSFIDLGNSFAVNPNDLSTSTVSTGILSVTGTWLFELEVKDSSSEVAYSNIMTITVNQPLSVVLSSSSSQTDVGGSLTFANTTEGGTLPFTYSYSVTPNSGFTESTSPGNTFTFNSPGTYTVKLVVEDATGSISSSTVVINVNSSPTISVQPQSYSIDPEQSFNQLSSTVSEGTGPYNWQWYEGTPGTGSPVQNGGSGAGQVATFSPTQGGSYYVVFKDSTGATVTSLAAKVTVFSPPYIIVTPSTTTIYNVQTLPLTATVVNGSGSFTYSWTVGGSPTVLSTSSEFSFSESTSGSYVIWLNVTDTGTTPNYKLPSKSLNITVLTAPVLNVIPSSATIDTTQSILLKSVISGSSKGDLSYAWSIGGSPTVVGNDKTFDFTESVAGVYKVWLNVTVGTSKTPLVITASSTITVDSAPTISSQPSSVTIDSGQSITITSTATGGTGSFSWQWYDKSGPISGDSGTSATATATFNSADTGVYVVFTDTGTTSAATPIVTVQSSSVAITVDPSPSISVQPSPSTIDSGQSVTLSATVTGGTGTFSWSLYSTASSTAINTGSGTSASATVSPTSTTSYYFVFTDTGVSSGATPASAATVSTNKVTVTVNTKPAVSISPSTAVIDVGQSILLTPSISGGSGSFSYAWTLGTSSTVLGSKSSFSFSEPTSGSYKVILTVTDNVTSYVFSASSTITVDSAPTISSQPSSVTIDSGQSITITSTATGGTGSFSWQWYDKSGPISGDSGTSATATATFNSADTGVYVVFTDTGTTSAATPIVTVQSSSVAITVDPSPSISVQPSPSTIDSGQSVTLSATVTGGTGTFSWSLYSTASSTAINTGLRHISLSNSIPHFNNIILFRLHRYRSFIWSNSSISSNSLHEQGNSDCKQCSNSHSNPFFRNNRFRSDGHTNSYGQRRHTSIQLHMEHRGKQQASRICINLRILINNPEYIRGMAQRN
ncbi:MAG: putative membrane protein [Thermoplasmatales archaeon I-plasma]|nr:MAG: putative membrane protein [Thermoplasmatales archaeon I-plasma]